MAGSDYIEQELEVITQTGVDYIVFDGSEGGDITTLGHFLKAMAIGADEVYIGSIALMATMAKCL